MTVFDNDANDSITSAFDIEMKMQNSSKNMLLFYKIVPLNNVDIVGKDFMEFLGFNCFKIHLIFT